MGNQKHLSTVVPVLLRIAAWLAVHLILEEVTPWKRFHRFCTKLHLLCRSCTDQRRKIAFNDDEFHGVFFPSFRITHDDYCRSNRLHLRSIPHAESFRSRLDVVTFSVFCQYYVDRCTTVDLEVDLSVIDKHLGMDLFCVSDSMDVTFLEIYRNSD